MHVRVVGQSYLTREPGRRPGTSELFTPSDKSFLVVRQDLSLTSGSKYGAGLYIQMSSCYGFSAYRGHGTLQKGVNAGRQDGGHDGHKDF